MSNILFDLSGKIDQQTATTLSFIKKVADSLNFFQFDYTSREKDNIANRQI